MLWFSPRMRGCFHLILFSFYRAVVFPAYAGMFPPEASNRKQKKRFPRVCGDVSLRIASIILQDEFSPRMRGCFQAVLNKEIYAQVFPAYAGMFLQFFQLVVKVLRFPRVCGDVSTSRLITMGMVQFSPRMRGCFYQ